MTTTLSPPIRILALVGALAAVALGILFYTHARSSSNDSTPLPAPSHAQTGTKPVVPVTHPKPAPAGPAVVLAPGLPVQVARVLRHSKVAVVALYTRGGRGDHALLTEARSGAVAVHAGFAAVDVLNEKTAKKMSSFAGVTTAPPAILVVARPGKIVNRFDGYVDRQIVAQAAHNAGARR